MKNVTVLLASASLFACAQENTESETAQAEEPAALTFAGADYGDDQAAKLAHGARVSALMGCQGCHGANLQGRTMEDAEDFNAPNLSLLLASYSDEELAKAVRGGVAKDGRELWAMMPSPMYSQLSDADYDALVAHLRTFEPTGEEKPPFEPDPGFLEAVEAGMIGMAPAEVAKIAAEGPLDLGDEHAFGRYIATTSCAECHGEKLQGFPGFSPNLDIAASYEEEQLKLLLSEGVGLSREDLGLMSLMGRVRYSQFTEEERDALVKYLHARAEANTQ